MYTPSLPHPRPKSDRATTHLHQPNETLSDHENAQNFKTYIAGRAHAYSAIISTTLEQIQNAKATQERNPHDAALWALTEGLTEGLKEILQLLKNSKERNEPTS